MGGAGAGVDRAGVDVGIPCSTGIQSGAPHPLLRGWQKSNLQPDRYERQDIDQLRCFAVFSFEFDCVRCAPFRLSLGEAGASIRTGLTHHQSVLSLCPVLPRRALQSKPFASVLRVCSSMPPVSFGQLVTTPLIRLGLETGIEAAIGRAHSRKDKVMTTETAKPGWHVTTAVTPTQKSHTLERGRTLSTSLACGGHRAIV
jgi:hypothetical protein